MTLKQQYETELIKKPALKREGFFYGNFFKFGLVNLRLSLYMFVFVSSAGGGVTQ
jgi:hypothetical protein